MTSGMQAALDDYASAFGPDPYRELPLIQVAPCNVNGYAFPSAIGLSETNFNNRNAPDVVDLTFFGTAHEVAHRWWGGQVRPTYAKERGFVPPMDDSIEVGIFAPKKRIRFT